MLDEPLPDGWVRIADPGSMRSERMVLLEDGRVLRIVEPFEDEPVASAIFDPATGLWTATEHQHHAKVRDRTVVVTAEGWVHVSGGMREIEPREPIAACELLKPATGEWFEMPPLPEPSYLHAAVTVSGRVFVIGGKTTEPRLGTGLRDLQTMASWAPGEPAWTVLPEMPFATSSIRACVLDDDSIIVWGYARETGTLRFVGGAWWVMDVIDPGSAIVPIAGGFLSLGGHRGETTHDLVRAWHREEGWRGRRDLPAARKTACAVRLRDGRIAVIGGTNTMRRWEATPADAEVDIEYRSLRREQIVDVPVREVFIEDGDGWAALPSPTLWGREAFVLPDGRVFVHDIGASYLWTPRE